MPRRHQGSGRAPASNRQREHTRGQSEASGQDWCDAWSDNSYAITSGTVDINSVSIPYVVEAWAIKDKRTDLFVYVNRTPITGKINAARDKRDIDAYGCGLADNIATAPKDEQFEIKLSIITPFMPITSDGKEPNLDPFLSGIERVVSKAVNAARSPKRSSTSIKQVVLDNLDDVIALISTNGKYRFQQRQFLYKMRPIVRNEIDKMLKTGTFNGIITDYEYENGEIPGMYREPRGSIYHPHRKETITLGTLMVENYKRPEWTYNHLLYNEKEGFNAALKDENWPEQHDCMLISSKGFSSRAARDLVDKLAEHDEPVKVFIVHDADGYGTMIYQTFQEATKARGARKIKIINLGLEPWEAVEMGLKVETPEDDDDDDDSNGGKKTRRKPVADYVYKYDQENGTDWAEWLQTHRVELNEMTTEEFIEWLTAKMAEHGDGKLIPPPEVLEAELAKRVEAKLREDITERILREARLDEQVAAAVAATEMPDADELADGIEEMFEEDPAHEWRDHIEDCANQAVGRETEEG